MCGKRIPIHLIICPRSGFVKDFPQVFKGRSPLEIFRSPRGARGREGQAFLLNAAKAARVTNAARLGTESCPMRAAPGRDTSSGRRCPSPEVPPWPESINQRTFLHTNKLVQPSANADYAASVETCEVFPGKNFGFLGTRVPRKQRSKRVYTRRDMVLFICM